MREVNVKSESEDEEKLSTVGGNIAIYHKGSLGGLGRKEGRRYSPTARLPTYTSPLSSDDSSYSISPP